MIKQVLQNWQLKIMNYLMDDLIYEHKRALGIFFDGYGEKPSANLRIYGPFTFMNLVMLDRLNNLKSCIRRYNKGDRNYRLVSLLESPAFCEQIAEQTLKLTSTNDDVA